MEWGDPRCDVVAVHVHAYMNAAVRACELLRPLLPEPLSSAADYNNLQTFHADGSTSASLKASPLSLSVAMKTSTAAAATSLSRSFSNSGPNTDKASAGHESSFLPRETDADADEDSMTNSAQASSPPAPSSSDNSRQGGSDNVPAIAGGISVAAVAMLIFAWVLIRRRKRVTRPESWSAYTQSAANWAQPRHSGTSKVDTTVPCSETPPTTSYADEGPLETRDYPWPSIPPASFTGPPSPTPGESLGPAFIPAALHHRSSSPLWQRPLAYEQSSVAVSRYSINSWESSSERAR